MSRKHNNNQNATLLNICILTAGRVDLFEKCIDTILPMMKPEYQICVFNNGSPSPEYNQAYKKLPEGSVVKQTNNNVGFPGGANASIRLGKSPLVLFVSDDIFLHDNTIDTLIKRMDEPQIALCGLKLIFPEDSNDPSKPAGKVQHIGHAVSIRGEIVHPLIGWSANNPKCCISKDVISVTGACFIVRRKLFQQARGFNEIYGRGYYEDVDLCLTLRNMGYRISIDTEATATHGTAETYKARKNDPPPDLQRNASIFSQRHGKSLIWTEWMFF